MAVAAFSVEDRLHQRDRLQRPQRRQDKQPPKSKFTITTTAAVQAQLVQDPACEVAPLWVALVAHSPVVWLPVSVWVWVTRRLTLLSAVCRAVVPTTSSSP